MPNASTKKKRTKKPRRSKLQVQETRVYAYELLRKGFDQKEVRQILKDEYGLSDRVVREDYLHAKERIEVELLSAGMRYVHEIKQLIQKGITDRSLIVQNFAKKYADMPEAEVLQYFDRAWEDMNDHSPTERKDIRRLSLSRYNSAIVSLNRSLQAYDERISNLKNLIADIQDNKELKKSERVREVRLNQSLIADIESKKVAATVQITAIQTKLDDLQNLHVPKVKNRFEELLAEIEKLSPEEQELALKNAAIAKAMEGGSSNDVKAALQLINEENYGKVGETTTNLSIQMAEQIAGKIDDQTPPSELMHILGVLDKAKAG